MSGVRRSDVRTPSELAGGRMQGPYTIHVAKKAQHVEFAVEPEEGAVFTRCGLTWPPRRWPDNHAWVDPGGPVGANDTRCPACFGVEVS